MKRLLSALIIVFMVYGTFLSCKDTEKKTSADNVTIIENSENLNADSYQPGSDWKLAWSDEFNTDTILSLIHI